MTTIEKCDKKGGPIIKELLEEAKSKSITDGLNPDFLFIQRAFVGGGYRSKVMEIKGRGKIISQLLYS